MSTDKGFQGWEPPICQPSCTRWSHEDEIEFYDGKGECSCGNASKKGDEKLLRYLYEHRHTTPFEMAGMVIEVQAPIFVFRQWHRHRTQSYNELSARYTELPDVFYIPSEERIVQSAASSSNKQAKGKGELNEPAYHVQAAVRVGCDEAYQRYKWILAAGVSPELARCVLPVNIYSRMRASANLHNWLHFLTLRLDEHAQWETRQFAAAVAEFIKVTFPRTYQLFAEKKG